MQIIIKYGTLVGGVLHGAVALIALIGFFSFGRDLRFSLSLVSSGA